MSEKKSGFKYVDFSKAPRKIFELVLLILKIVVIIAIVALVAAFTVVPAIATRDPSKIIEPAMKVKDVILHKE